MGFKSFFWYTLTKLYTECALCTVHYTTHQSRFHNFSQLLQKIIQTDRKANKKFFQTRALHFIWLSMPLSKAQLNIFDSQSTLDCEMLPAFQKLNLLSIFSHFSVSTVIWVDGRANNGIIQWNTFFSNSWMGRMCMCGRLSYSVCVLPSQSMMKTTVPVWTERYCECLVTGTAVVCIQSTFHTEEVVSPSNILSLRFRTGLCAVFHWNAEDARRLFHYLLLVKKCFQCISIVCEFWCSCRFTSMWWNRMKTKNTQISISILMKQSFNAK